jgi:hypothetical protein
VALPDAPRAGRHRQRPGPAEASEMLIGKARQRARGMGDNLSLALVRFDPIQ